MKEIKFRGKRIDNGEWIYGSLLDSDIIVSGRVDVDGDYIGISEWCSVEIETVGQYTGLKDKNGKEIYEGDITEYGWAITWHNGCAGRWYDGQFASMNELDIERIEVIGNIYANPELLEVTP